MGFPILTAILLCPIIGMLVIIGVPGQYKKAIRIIALTAAAASLVLSIIVFASFDLSGDKYQFVEKVPWLESMGISYHLGVTGISAPLVLLTGIVIFTGILTMWELENRIKEFFAFMLLLVSGVFGVFMSLDLFFFFFFYEVAVLPMYPLIAIWGSTRKEYGAMKLTIYLLAGSALVIPALLGVYWASGVILGPGLETFDLTVIEQLALPLEFQLLWFPFVFIGFGVLGGMWPFHTWSPVGHVAAPHAVSMLHAGVLMKLGAFGILRIGIMLMPEGAQVWCPFFAILATFNIVYGAFVALKQTDLKFVIGYSSVSHMGIVLLGLCTLSQDGMNGAAFQMFAHGVMTALLFSSVGYIYDRTHTRMIPELGGISSIMPRAATFFIVAALCGAGVPGFASFWAELLVFIAAFKHSIIIGVLTISGLILTALYALRVIQRAFFGEPNPKFVKLEDVPHGLAIPRYVLVATLLLFGLFPRLILDMIDKENADIRENMPPPVQGLPDFMQNEPEQELIETFLETSDGQSNSGGEL